VSVRFDQLVENRGTVKVPVSAGEVIVKYAPAAVTPALMTAIIESENPVETFLTAAVRSWDVLDDDGHEWPITRQVERTSDEGVVYIETVSNLDRLPLAFLRAVQSAILEDMRPKEKKGAS
jgi:hypothetical protein